MTFEFHDFVTASEEMPRAIVNLGLTDTYSEKDVEAAILRELEAHAPTTAVEPSPLDNVQQMALFPETSPFLEELERLDVNALTPLEAINKLYEWKQRYTDKG